LAIANKTCKGDGPARQGHRGDRRRRDERRHGLRGDEQRRRDAGNRLVVILNDNDMSIAPPVGGLSAYLARLVSSREPS
jgi:hypothetical protein